MAHISRSQLLVYGAIAVVVLLLGARWVSASGGEPAADGELALATGGGSPLDEAGGDRGGEPDALVHVAGAVRKPGVYRLPIGARVADAVERAGGPGARAEVSGINLAARLSDGQQVVVPVRGGSASGSGRSGSALGDGGPTSLGSATPEQLETIEGIGPVTAASIIEFRDQRGGLASIDELDEVSGIGPATLEALRSRLQP